MKRVLLIIFITILIILAGLLVWLRHGVDQDQVQSVLANALGPEFTVEIKSARISPLQREVAIGHMTISTARDNHAIFRTDTLLISGIGPGLIFRKNIALSTLMLDTFTIDWDDSLPGGNDETKDDESIDKLAIESLDLVNGTIIIRENGQVVKRMNTLNLKAGLSLEFMSEHDLPNSLQRSITVDSLGFLFSDDRYRFSLAGFDFNQQDSFLTLTSMELLPVGGYFPFMSSLEYATNMFEIEIADFTATGIDAAAYQNDNMIKARSLDFDTFNIHVAKDKQLPDKPDKKPPTLINASIQKLPFDIQLDSLFFQNTNIQYSEQDENGTRPGTISFMNSTIRLSDVNTLSSEPARLVAVTYLQNHSELNTELMFTLNDGTFHMTGSGNLQPFDLKQLNSIFMDLEGIEIESGLAHEVDFYFEMVDDTSSGRMHLVYDNLKMKMVDKDDHSGSFKSSIKSFIANNVVVKSANLADNNDENRSGVIDHVREKDSPFFQHIWHSLRSGIYDIVLRI